MAQLIGALLCVLLIIGYFVYAVRSDRPLIEHTLSHWQQTLDGMSGTSTDFYEAVTELIREQNLPDVQVKRVEFYEGALWSDKREYLRVRRADLSFDVCVAPFGAGLFVSTWLCRIPSPFVEYLASVPIVHWLARAWSKFVDRDTYYRYDSAAMFQDAVQRTVLAVLDQLSSDQGLEPLAESERKPIMRDLYGRGRETPSKQSVAYA